MNHTSTLKLTALLIGVLLGLPILSVIGQSLFAGVESISHLWNTVLSEYISNSLMLMLGVAVGTLLIGVPTAWLTTMCKFPGRDWLNWALLLPLAMPAYVIAYTYTGILDYAGPIQSTLRELTGWGYGDYHFWDVRSLSGAILMLILVLYPYVYLTARAAFFEQSSLSMEVAKSLGYSTPKTWFKVALPLARPAIIAGVTLALMETLADYGTVQYFGVSTFSTGIFRTFYGLGDPASAALLATGLLTFVAALIFVERYSRRGIAYHQSKSTPRVRQLIELRGFHALMATLACALPFLLGFMLPALQLLFWSLFEAELDWPQFINLAWNTFYLAALAALIAVILAFTLAYAQRFEKQRVLKLIGQFAGLGYALPGTIIAIGVLTPLIWFDHQLIKLFNWFGIANIGLLLSGTIVALLIAYAVRFLAVALGTVQAGLNQISPSIDYAAKSLGRSTWTTLRLIHAPIMRSSLFTALLIVFVDVLKELPATLMLRPFDFNTLAIRAYELATDEQLIAAAPPSLLIVVVGLIPVLLINRAITRSAS
ncbi:iron ABC transporter permease [Marinobacterium sp. LSUCC0821]|uniref:ABC transporter permease n=1 Tax=Marinobacterium sp. LSUCC0821 TaxID=2668067 RepID=UPI0014522D95|nr:iron ABC transporter permease [Marinobacterium sp. LSUCC0821]QJD70906.1 iron ABC transporter permease [Marinobacterium sp. LSUCC0821]